MHRHLMSLVSKFDKKNPKGSVLNDQSNVPCALLQGGLTALFTKPSDGLPPYRTTSGDRSVWQFPIDIFPFYRVWPVTKEPVAL